MAVATPAALGKAERPLPATVATRDAPEEPVAMAEEQVSNDGADEAQNEMASQEVSSEAAEPAADEVTAETDDEVEASGEVMAEAPAEAQAEAQAEATAEAPAPAAPAGLPPTEFNWTPLEFTPLVWRYDAEPEQDTAIDLREPAAVDVREKAGRRQPRRKKANH